MKRSRLLAVAMPFALAGILAGCGSGGTKTVTQQPTQTVIEKTVTESAPAPATRQTRAPTRTAATIPDLVGERLDVAEDELHSKHIPYKEIGGGTFGVVVPSNWTVCETRPTAGGTVGSGDRVRLIIDREC